MSRVSDGLPGDLFEPDIILPLQILENSRHRTIEPEKKLMLAVLEDAIYCFQKYLFTNDDKGKIAFRNAEAWLLLDRDRDKNRPFSFESICDTLGFDQDYVRKGLMAWKKEAIKK